jgi:hypothetical protein
MIGSTGNQTTVKPKELFSLAVRILGLFSFALAGREGGWLKKDAMNPPERAVDKGFDGARLLCDGKKASLGTCLNRQAFMNEQQIE